MTASLYIHIPFCLQKCDYCDFFSRPQNGKIPDSYVEALINEADFYADCNDITCWKTIYIGGGTPSLLSPKQITTLLKKLSKRIGSGTQEITMEMNPESVSKDKLSAAANSGVSRLSLGIQSFNDKALKAINRHCTSKRAKDGIEIIKANWNGQLNLDSIAGLPEQTEEEFIASLNQILFYEPDHISLYTLTVEEGTPLHIKIEDGIIHHDPDSADEQWIKGRELILSKGYGQYEVSNFSKPGKESRHNLTYWRQQDYVGIGAGASGTIYGQESMRWTNTQDIEKYISFWNSTALWNQADLPRQTEAIDLETKEFEFLMMGLRTLEGINSAQYERKFSKISPWNGNLGLRLGKETGPWKNFSKEKLTLEKSEADGSTTYALNHNGILLLNKFLVDLL
ncbi:radical SAM family heme chaperone HemW [Treponema sp.]|uniref:radical SAM family heme chaperone HemW n=1 Tax=Treponema sp. TaxID=166 RepID=UPI00388D25D9